MTTSHLVSFSELTLDSDKNFNHFINTGIKIVTFRAAEALNIDNCSFYTVGNSQRTVPNLFGLFTKDRIQKLKLWSCLCFAFGCGFTNQNISGTNFCTNPDDTFNIQVIQILFTGVRNISGYFFRTKFCFPNFCCKFLDMY